MAIVRLSNHLSLDLEQDLYHLSKRECTSLNSKTKSYLCPSLSYLCLILCWEVFLLILVAALSQQTTQREKQLSSSLNQKRGKLQDLASTNDRINFLKSGAHGQTASELRTFEVAAPLRAGNLRRRATLSNTASTTLSRIP